MNIASLLIKTSILHPNRWAIAIGGEFKSTYLDKANRVARLAGGLKDRVKVKAGDRVALAMKNCAEYSDILFASWQIGAITVPMNAKLHAKEFAYAIEDSGARICFVTEDLFEAIQGSIRSLSDPPQIIVVGSEKYAGLLEANPAELTEVKPDDVAWLFYTSGTTGRSKGAMLSHRNLLMMTIGYYGDVDNVVATDTLLHCAPMSHGSGLYILPYVAKGACQILPRSGGFEPTEFLDLVSAHESVSCFLAPTMIKRILDIYQDSFGNLKNLKTIIYGGGPMYSSDCLAALKLFGPKLVQIYGQGESPMTITALSRAAHVDDGSQGYIHRIESVGTVRTDLEVKIVDHKGKELKVGEIGEIIVRGDVVMRGYWENAKATKESLKNGWLYTGDLGLFDEEGDLTLKDRSKDLIISGGSNIYPREVEEILVQHKYVEEASVVGQRDPEWGEKVVAFIVPKEKGLVTGNELDKLCLKHIARYKRPKEYKFVNSLPKNNYGKVLKKNLRDMLET